MTYLVVYEQSGTLHFALGMPQWQSGIRSCREFRSRRDAEALRKELASAPDVTAAYVVTCGEGK